MRILVVSDTHGNQAALFKAIMQQPDANIVFHLGDCIREASAAVLEFPNHQFFLVRGNNDWFAGRSFKDFGLQTLNDKRIFYTHGHRYGVKSDYDALIKASKRQNADIVLFGHTHHAQHLYENGLHLINPGSLGFGQPTYAVIDITAAGIAPNIVRLK